MKPWCGVSFVTQVLTGRVPGRVMRSRCSYLEPSLYSILPDAEDMVRQVSNVAPYVKAYVCLYRL